MSTGRRSPLSSGPKRQSQTTTSKTVKTPAELITLRYHEDMVYVAPTNDFEELLNDARGVFADLSDVPRDRIAFSVNVRVGGAVRTVRIAPMAWSRVLASLAKFEIVDVSVLPQSQISRAAKSDTDIRSTFLHPNDSQSRQLSRADFLLDNDNLPPYASANRAPEVQVTFDGDEKHADDFNEKSSFLSVPQSPPMTRRCASALGWLGSKIH